MGTMNKCPKCETRVCRKHSGETGTKKVEAGKPIWFCEKHCFPIGTPVVLCRLPADMAAYNGKTGEVVGHHLKDQTHEVLKYSVTLDDREETFGMPVEYVGRISTRRRLLERLGRLQ